MDSIQKYFSKCIWWFVLAKSKNFKFLCVKISIFLCFLVLSSKSLTDNFVLYYPELLFFCWNQRPSLTHIWSKFRISVTFESVIRTVTFSSTCSSCHCGSTEIPDCLPPKRWSYDSIHLDLMCWTRPARPESLLNLHDKCTGTAGLSPTCQRICWPFL